MSSEIGRVGRPATVRQNAAHPLAAMVFVRRRRPRPSLRFPGLRRLASGTAQTLWISIAVSSSIRRLKDVAIVMDLHELAPVGGRATGGRDGRRLKRFAQASETLPDRPWLRDEGKEPDAAAAGWTLERRLLPPASSVSPTQSVRCRASGALPKWREFDDAVGPRLLGLAAAAGPNPAGRLMPRQHVADASDSAASTADHEEPLDREGLSACRHQGSGLTPRAGAVRRVAHHRGRPSPGATGVVLGGTLVGVRWPAGPGLRFRGCRL